MINYKIISFKPINVRSLSPTGVNIPPRTPSPYLNFIKYIKNFNRDIPFFFQQYDQFKSKDPTLVTGTELQSILVKFNQLMISLHPFLDVKNDIDNFRNYFFNHHTSIDLKTFQLSLEMFLDYFEKMDEYFPNILTSQRKLCSLDELFPNFSSESKQLRKILDLLFNDTSIVTYKLVGNRVVKLFN